MTAPAAPPTTGAARAGWISGLLIVWTVWDLTLAIIAGFFPDVWFRFIHGVQPVDPQGLLRRTAAIWLAFSLFHFVAWKT